MSNWMDDMPNEDDLGEALIQAAKWGHYRSLLGKRVKLTYRYENRDESALICLGTLLAFGDGGDFEILEDDGFVHYGWPMLHVEEAP